ncbi:TetR/AcrR family transcriptional regulator [Brachybacterium sp. MASK1Z-5]|uniref:TetR/AcrR family transcriptional regulator n=1 Tax=Brachybacterium halotolerans TaxID=2795215 RepID=A0ABS1B9L7_9MICO|nr:TetR/AcrR family transcriptional regulator [Brachybacterium halotolerans]
MRTHGAKELSLRALAQHLGSSTSTLYRYVSGKQELVMLLADRVIAHASEFAESADEPWDERLRAGVSALYTVVRENPGLAPFLTEGMPTGPAAIDAKERMISLLLEAGFEPSVAARASITLARFAVGFAVQADHEPTGAPVDLTAHPALRSVTHHLPTPIEEEFDLGLGLIIEGLRSRRSGACTS